MKNTFKKKIRTKLTGGGLILQIPDFSAIGRILAMYPSGSRNSSAVGSKTGASGGLANLKSESLLSVMSFLRYVPKRDSNAVCPSNLDPMIRPR